MSTHKQLLGIRARAYAGLNETLGFFDVHGCDPAGGFYGKVDRQLASVPGAERSIVLHARLMWTYASAYRMFGNPRHLELAQHALSYIQKHFIDPHNGGGYWTVHADGTPADTRKYVYGQAFIIYGGAEMMRAANCTKALQMAKDVYALLETHARDPKFGGYFETYDRAWNRTFESFNIPSIEAGSKALNTHLHLIESYTNLMRVWDDAALRSRVHELISIMSNNLLDTQHFHYKPYMTDDWGTTKSLFSFGHDIEGAWLLVEAAHAYGDEQIIKDSIPISVRIADSCRDGLDPITGGMYAENEEGALIKDMNWWVQAEAVVGFFNAYQLTGDAKYIECMNRVWDYIDEVVIDREGGVFREWLSDASLPATHSKNAYPISGWKTPYHNARMYMELIERIDGMLKAEGRP